jgi:hypothetical protein
VSAVPARERTLCPHKPRGGGDACPGLVFAGADYDVAAHAGGAALVDTADGGYRIVLGDHTALRSKAAFQVSEPLAPLFPECTDLFDGLMEMLTARRAQLAPGDEQRGCRPLRRASTSDVQGALAAYARHDHTG